MCEADWAAEFLKYQSSPEFHLLNSRMTLEEFKKIYWMEWIHRLWGRVIGITFVVPAVYFVTRRKVSKLMAGRLLAIAGLIGFQGFVGWWMVKSGLKDDLFAPGSHPRVSQYRLTAHLGAAFIVYLSMFWNGIAICRNNSLIRKTDLLQIRDDLHHHNHPTLRRFKVATVLLCALVFTTAMSGALVAGLDAGLIYNDFPFMGGRLTPPKSELYDPFYSHVPPDANGEHSDLVWRNMLENPSLVQLDHRILAVSAFTACLALYAYSRRPNVAAHLHPKVPKGAVHSVLGFALLQVTLGISTLLYLVPTTLASLHQAGALALLTATVNLWQRSTFPRHAARVFEKRIKTDPVIKVQFESQLARLEKSRSAPKPQGASMKIPLASGAGAGSARKVGPVASFSTVATPAKSPKMLGKETSKDPSHAHSPIQLALAEQQKSSQQRTPEATR
jgi:heme a synthase